jgi:hypothetical protein
MATQPGGRSQLAQADTALVASGQGRPNTPESTATGSLRRVDPHPPAIPSVLPR